MTISMAFRALSSEIAPGPNTAACRPTGETDGEAEKHRTQRRAGRPAGGSGCRGAQPGHRTAQEREAGR